ncbi:sigma 54-interacting transcriptional regulator [Opacimonas viscosa]|uniref:Sigma 54-interacting transcriptional regulator n=1 Tax=Opacimonas viscosa TaxID=2961944 RepID=A0AA41X257_9ALTE|nr:sigma 54-interacting transcriptional regulator [Opacimonas viscosa]MCP3428106.1 sigma 54-interacting transcriptional regulator [Opacimonas viscosa]
MKILLVDDDTSLLRLMTIRLEQSGHEVLATNHPVQALQHIQQGYFDVVLSDLRMPEIDGLRLFERIRETKANLPVIIMTANGTIKNAIEATQKGVLGFIEKPINHEELTQLLNKISHNLHPYQSWSEHIVTRNMTMLALLEKAHRIAQKDVSVLITGASGTGKEVLAKAIHEASPRSQEKFIAINCGAIPENLLESELFGHTKGAFTGAVNASRGLFLEADKGTLFLDEIGDMPHTLQVKLLRALQEQKIKPVGAQNTIDIDVRVLSATHRNLEIEMQSGQFREDLYYRLNVVNLHLPPLKDRAEDIPLLARELLRKSVLKHNVDISSFADDAMELLVTHTWQGNVRQLVNTIEQCVALCDTKVIPKQLVEQSLRQVDKTWPTLSEAKDAFEFSYLKKLLHMTDGNVTRAANLAGRNRSDMHKLLKKHELDAADFRQVIPLHDQAKVLGS